MTFTFFECDIARCGGSSRTFDASPLSRKIARYLNRGDTMRFISGTPKILLIYVVFMFAGQAIAVGIGLLLDPYPRRWRFRFSFRSSTRCTAWPGAWPCSSATIPRSRRRIQQATVVVRPRRPRAGCSRRRCWRSISATRLALRRHDIGRLRNTPRADVLDFLTPEKIARRQRPGRGSWGLAP